jgi:hypothetical protein
LVIASEQGYVNLAWTAAAVLALVVLTAAFITRVRIASHSSAPWMIGGVSLIVSLVPWWLLASGQTQSAALLYQGLKIPQGIIQFWDLSLVLQSVDCARWGFDIYAVGNGCLADPSIYAPGMVWLQYVPGGIFAEANAGWLGVAMIIVSSLALVLLARWSTGLGQVVLLIAAIGAPWVLLLERGNVDAVVIWVAVITVALAHRWNNLTTWTIAAVLIWLVGTWKYYPFALGILLLPLVRIPRGWTVLAGFALATMGFFIYQWRAFASSISDNSEALILYDFPAMGRLPIISRMTAEFDFESQPLIANAIVALLVVAALWWGFNFGRALPRAPLYAGMLASSGSLLFLASVLVAGFGFGYKAAFLLLLVPLSALPHQTNQRFLLYSSVVALLLIAIPLIVAYSILLTSLAGITVAAMGLGASSAILWRNLGVHRSELELTYT